MLVDGNIHPVIVPDGSHVCVQIYTSKIIIRPKSNSRIKLLARVKSHQGNTNKSNTGIILNVIFNI